MHTLENIANIKTLATLEVLNVKMGEIALSLWTPPEDQLSNVIVPSDTQLHFVKLLWRTIHVLTALAGEYTFLGNSTIYFSTFLVKFQWENNYVFLYWYFDETKNWFHEKILIYFVLYIYIEMAELVVYNHFQTTRVHVPLDGKVRCIILSLSKLSTST